MPNASFNDRCIDGARKAADAAWPHLNVVVIDPVRTPIVVDRPLPAKLGRAESIPAVACSARLLSFKASDPSMDFSEVAVVWFQDTFAFPPSADVVAELARLDWATHAIDLEW